MARLGDYGLSKLVTHSRGSLSMGRGTPYYMAPELLQRRGDNGGPVVLEESTIVADVFMEIAKNLLRQVAVLNDISQEV